MFPSLIHDLRKKKKKKMPLTFTAQYLVAKATTVLCSRLRNICFFHILQQTAAISLLC